MGAMSEDPTPNGVPARLVQATVRLLAEQGPSAIKARTVAAETGMSTMVVYSHFGGIPELIHAVVDHGYRELGAAFSQIRVSDDPIADLFRMALATREVARANPHLYDLMFGLSTRATYRPTPDTDVRRSGHSAAFQAAYVHVTDACARLVDSGRIDAQDPRLVAAGLWSFVHGYITLELGDHFAEFDDPVGVVLLRTGVTFAVGLGDDPERAMASHQAALRAHRRKLGRLKRASG
jgi:AcrR family transcriptional regulator